jgi:hypothetical protein
MRIKEFPKLIVERLLSVVLFLALDVLVHDIDVRSAD